MKNKEEIVNFLIGLLIWVVATAIITGALFLISNAYLGSFEGRCQERIKLEASYDVTDSGFMDSVVRCNNYFNGHIITEYWIGAIMGSVIISILMFIMCCMWANSRDFYREY